MSPRVVQVIESEVARGCGHPDGCGRAHEHPLYPRCEAVRRVKQYHTLDGEFLAERDPLALSDSLVHSLIEYGDHKSDCLMNTATGYSSKPRCDCGWDALAPQLSLEREEK